VLLFHQDKQGQPWIDTRNGIELLAAQPFRNYQAVNVLALPITGITEYLVTDSHGLWFVGEKRYSVHYSATSHQFSAQDIRPRNSIPQCFAKGNCHLLPTKCYCIEPSKKVVETYTMAGNNDFHAVT